MSLTSILKQPYRANIKVWFRHHFPNPGLKHKPQILVNSNYQNGADLGEIGTAFDYLVRFYLERMNNKTSATKEWVAETGYALILLEFASSKSRQVFIGYTTRRKVDRVKFVKYLSEELKTAKSSYKKFIKDGKLTNDLIRASIFLAKLDIKYRTGITDAGLDSIEKSKITELRQLISIVPWNEFKAEKRCLLNPTFGKGSTLVGGADADLIIDDLLIDIKASKYFSIEREALSQIIGYCLLSRIGGVNDKKIGQIKRVGIYFARYGILWQIPLSHFCSLRDYNLRAEEFKKLVLDREFYLIPQNITPEASLTYEDFKCPYCESKNYIKKGQTKSQKYRYGCKECKKSFTSTIQIDQKFDILNKLSF